MEFNLNFLLSAGITLVVVGIALAFGLLVQGEVQDEMTASSAEANATQDAIDGVANLTEQLPTIGIIIAAVVIISLLVGGFSFARR